MTDSSKLETLKELIESATAALNSANKIAQELLGGKVSKKSAENYTDVAQTLKSEDNIIEGVFDGQNMIGPDKRAYQSRQTMPANLNLSQETF
ncbi:MAG: hypothetical protein WCT36_02085 [Candidatus Gracilibacteria bacterium]